MCPLVGDRRIFDIVEGKNWAVHDVVLADYNELANKCKQGNLYSMTQSGVKRWVAVRYVDNTLSHKMRLF